MTSLLTRLYLLLITIVLLTVAAFYFYQPPAPSVQTLILRFYPMLGQQPLVLHQQHYANPNGEGSFKVNAFQLFISNIKLIGTNSSFIEPESYHLLRFDGDNNYTEAVIDKINIENYQQIELGVGVDPAANGTITIAGDLDPNSRMAWSWDVGYKFLLLEGLLELTEQQLPLVYHIGFDENYTRLRFPLNATSTTIIKHQENSSNIVMHFNIDILQLFTQTKPIDLAEISTVKFDKQHAALIAQGFKSFITLQPTNSKQ